MKKISIMLISIFFLLHGESPGLAKETQLIRGAGPSTVIVQLFVDEFSKLEGTKGYAFHVPPQSDKHAGGIRASDNFVFGRTGRPLNDEEKKLSKEEIILARIPVAFAVGSAVNISSLTISQIKDIFIGKITNWKDVGGQDAPILVIGREENEALFTVLKKEYPFFNSSQFNKVVKKDDAVISILNHEKGKYSIGFGARPNFEKAAVPIIAVKDFSAGVSLGLVYDKKNKEHPLVKAATGFMSSKKWTKIVTASGLLPPQQQL